MKRIQERDSPLKSKRSRCSVPRFDDSYRDRITPDRDRRDGKASSISPPRIKVRTHHGSKSRESERSGKLLYEGGHEVRDYGRGRSHEKAAAYKVICVSNINDKVSDGTVRDVLMREFKKHDAVDAKIVHDANERLAFVHFRNSDDAREARHAKGRMILFDRPVNLEPAYNNDSSRRESEPRPRRSYDEQFTSRPRGTSPAHSNTSSSSMGRRPQYGSMERHMPFHPPPNHHRVIPPPFQKDFGPSPEFRHPHMYMGEEKKERFPNYLHHIPPEQDEKATRTLFVGNLEVEIPDMELKRIFESYGVVEDVDIKRPHPDQGNAFAFVRFVNLDMAHRAKVAMSGQYIGKFQCKIGYGKATPTTKIWVGGLGPWTSLSHLEKEFDRFGAIKKIDFVKGDNHAYILYDSIDAAQAACQEMRGFPLGGPDRLLRIDFADNGQPPFIHQGPPGFQAPYERPQRAEQTFYSGGRGHDFHKKWQNNGGHPTRGHFPPKPHGEWTGHKDREQGQYHWKRERENWDPDSGREWQNRNPPHSPDMHANGGSFKRQPPSPTRSPVGRPRSISPHRERPYGNMERDRSPGRERRFSGRRADDDFDSPSRNGVESKRATTMQDLIKCCPMLWHGGLVLKNSAFPARMHIGGGSAMLVDSFLKDLDAEVPTLRITQRLRLEQTKLDDVSKRIATAGQHGYGILFGMPGTIQIPPGDSANPTQQRPLKNLVSYLKQKDAAGVIALSSKEEGIRENGVLYAFPPCPFSFGLLRQIAPNLDSELMRDDHLVIVIVKGAV